MCQKLLFLIGALWTIINCDPCIAYVYDQASMNDTIPEKFFNVRLQKQFPSSFYPPTTDGGGQAPFMYPFALSPRIITEGGWARQVSARELPVSTKMTGVQMRLIPSGARELHWHVDSEWAYMIYGEARITAVDQLGRAFVDDVKQGDLWFFPEGVGHSIQGLGKNGAFFVLVFDNGMFSPFQTFGLADWMNHVPRDVLAKNFGVSKSVFNKLPKEKLFIFEADLPLPLKTERAEAEKVTGPVPQSMAFFASKMKPTVTLQGGEVKIIDKNNFPITNVACAIVRLKPGALRELHWHPNEDEWQYYIEGKFNESLAKENFDLKRTIDALCSYRQARMSIFYGNGQASTLDFQTGDVGYVPKSLGHYVENTGNVDVVFIEVFATPYYEDVSLAQWLAHTPRVLVNSHIRTGLNFIDSIPKEKTPVKP